MGRYSSVGRRLIRAFWLVLSAMMLTSILLNLTLIDLLLAPLRDLSMAITNMAGQKPAYIRSQTPITALR